MNLISSSCETTTFSYFCPVSTFLCCSTSGDFSFNVLYTDDDICIAIEMSVDQIFILTGETKLLVAIQRSLRTQI